jgi:hypothetical protein
MGSYRPEFREIEAYSRQMREYINPFETLLIRSLAEAYMIASDEKRKRDANKPTGLQNETDMSDTERVKAIFMRAGTTAPKGKKPVSAPKGNR